MSVFSQSILPFAPPAWRGPSLPRLGCWLGAQWRGDRDRWVLWLPVLLGIGIALYFALPSEPAPWLAPFVCVLAVAGALVIARANAGSWVTAPLALVAITAGFALAQAHTLLRDPDTLARRLGPVVVEGRVSDLETFPDGARLLIDRPRLLETTPHDVLPTRARVRLRGQQPPIAPGDVVRVRAVLGPPPPPSMPGAYDFQRQAFFDGIGAVGFSAGRAQVVTKAAEGGFLATDPFARLRFRVAERVRDAVPGDAGAVIVALLVGEQRGIPEPAMEAIRNSGLAHLLSISGLHIGLVAAIVFMVMRRGLTLVPPLALTHPIKKWAAAVALLAAGVYVLLAGAPVPAQRSFFMLAIALVAVLVDRRPISMRLVAWAATLVLLLRPDSMLGPSFQMSFAAVAALIAAYEWHRRWRAGRPYEHHWPLKAGRYAGAVMLTTLIAGAATAPYAIHHFDRFQVYGVAANLVAIPLTSFWVMPWAVVAMLSMPFGLEQIGLAPMAWGVEGLLWVARTVAAWPGAVIGLPPLPAWSLAAVTLGGLWLLLWQKPWRWLGLLGVALGFSALVTATPPDVLVDGQAKVFAVRLADGQLAVSNTVGARAARDTWVRRSGVDGDKGDRAWPRQGVSGDGRLACDPLGCLYRHAGHTIALVLRGEALAEDCAVADLVISAVPVRRSCHGPKRVIDRFDLWRDGAHALWLTEDGWRIESSHRQRGDRPWVLAHNRAKPGREDGDDNAGDEDD